ncbi:DUF1345 domain-containing protein [Kribbella sp. NPDC000426]|uniref:DUF1345 domain-containing protein n=1 Tax=Kribbella sp. NPDC000426 TaxID=3154255 RepID=UPI003320DF38
MLDGVGRKLDAVVRVLLAAAGLAVLVVLWIVGGGRHVLLITLAGWDLLAAIFLTRQLLLVRRGRTGDDDPSRWLLPRRSMTARFAAVLLASAAGLSSGLLIVTLDSLDEDAGSFSAVRPFAALTVVLAWLILHAGYAMHYADLYFYEDKGLAFPEVETPNLLDFSYFAFAIGAAFATSDVEVRSRRLRYAVLWHSVVAFFYNAAVLGIAISTFTGK